jgi:transcriptional regulator
VTDDKLDLPQGTLDLLILKAVSLGPMHGWAISERLRQVSRDVLQVPQGSLYPALHRLENKGLVSTSWGVSENNRQAKYYALTAAGRRTLTAEIETWIQYAAAITKVVTATRQPA